MKFFGGNNRQQDVSGGTRRLPACCPVTDHKVAAFTLIELLVVLAIIGLLAVVGLPSLRNMTKSNSMIAANRQILDDVSYARQRALSDHTTVYMLFVPPQLIAASPPPSPVLAQQYTNLYGSQFTTYTLVSLRSAGDQPGRATPRYLTGWRTLPHGVFIATNKFDPNNAAAFAFAVNFPFPVATNFPSPVIPLPYIAFDYLGRLLSGRDEYIPLARGSIFYQRDAAGNFINAAADVQESPPFNSVNNSNVVHIDWLTGRARIERPEIQP
jgi:prepilin-type N-terminal cleavage/methylation domain-containing protein